MSESLHYLAVKHIARFEKSDDVTALQDAVQCLNKAIWGYKPRPRSALEHCHADVAAISPAAAVAAPIQVSTTNQAAGVSGEDNTPIPPKDPIP